MMDKKYLYQILCALLIGMTFCISCAKGPTEQNKVSHEADTQSVDTKSSQSVGDLSLKKIFGERFVIIGDFDGNRVSDTIFESYISAKTQKETYKALDADDWEHNQKLIYDNSPVSRLYSSIAGVDTFVVTKESQQTGLFRIENLGDLNGNGSDELGYVIEWADDSNLNYYHIISLADKKFEEIFSFQINEAINFDPDELFDKAMIVKSIGRNRIQYRFYSDSATVETGEHQFVRD